MTHYDYGFRIYNPGIGRFLSRDPLAGSFPMLTPYQFASNSPIQAIDLDGLEAWIVHYDHLNSNKGEAKIRLEFDKDLENPEGVYVVHHYSETSNDLASTTWGSANYSDYPNRFPNFSKGIMQQPKRKDGRSWISFEGHAKLTYGSLGVMPELFGQNFGGFTKAEGDLIGLTFSTEDGAGVPGFGYTSLSRDNTLDVGTEAGFIVGGGYLREFNRDAGNFLNTDELEYSPGIPFSNVVVNSFDDEASTRVGAAAKVSAGVGLDIELYFRINPRTVIDFTKEENKIRNTDSSESPTTPEEKF